MFARVISYDVFPNSNSSFCRVTGLQPRSEELPGRHRLCLGKSGVFLKKGLRSRSSRSFWIPLKMVKKCSSSNINDGRTTLRKMRIAKQSYSVFGSD